MQSAMTVLTVVAGLVFSVSCALLVEELIFGGLFKLFFQVKPVPVPVKVESINNQGRRNA